MLWYSGEITSWHMTCHEIDTNERTLIKNSGSNVGCFVLYLCATMYIIFKESSKWITSWELERGYLQWWLNCRIDRHWTRWIQFEQLIQQTTNEKVSRYQQHQTRWSKWKDEMITYIVCPICWWFEVRYEWTFTLKFSSVKRWWNMSRTWPIEKVKLKDEDGEDNVWWQ